MKWLLPFGLLALSGCELFHQFTCAPKAMVEACLQEAYAESNQTGLGPHCKALNDWALAHHWQGGGVTPQ